MRDCKTLGNAQSSGKRHIVSNTDKPHEWTRKVITDSSYQYHMIKMRPGKEEQVVASNTDDPWRDTTSVRWIEETKTQANPSLIVSNTDEGERERETRRSCPGPGQPASEPE
jgi:hypothetical protein